MVNKGKKEIQRKGKNQGKGKKCYAVKHKDYLSLLSAARNKKNRRNKLIDIAENSELKAISECVQNILRGTVPISKKQLNSLKRHRHALRNLAKRQFSAKKKKDILKQKGGIIGALLPLAIKAIGGLFGGV